MDGALDHQFIGPRCRTVIATAALHPIETRAQQWLRDVLGLQIGDGTALTMKLVIARQKAGRNAVP